MNRLTTMPESYVEQAELDRLVEAVRRVPQEHFQCYQGARHDQVGTALVDAVFSIRARYDGVATRLEEFAALHPEAVNSLEALSRLPEPALRAVMGNGVTAGVTKASAVLEAAQAFRSLDTGDSSPLETASDVRDLIGRKMNADGRLWVDCLKDAYTGVHGLGWVTFRYFLMLVGIPGVKADIMIRGFVAEALGVETREVSAVKADALVVAAHGAVASELPGAPDLTQFDHGLWLYQRGR